MKHSNIFSLHSMISSMALSIRSLKSKVQINATHPTYGTLV